MVSVRVLSYNAPNFSTLPSREVLETVSVSHPTVYQERYV